MKMELSWNIGGIMMFKVWKGPEMEGTHVGVMTMFVCSDVSIEAKRLISLLVDNRDVRRVYFGAGRHEFAGIDDWKLIYDYAFIHSVELVMEIPPDRIGEYVSKYDNLAVTFIVPFYNAPFTYNSMQFKIDDRERVTIYNPSTVTSLTTLQSNNLFDCDTMLIQEED